MPCHFCQNNSKKIDYKDTDTLSKFLSPSNKIMSARRTKLCPKHQRNVARAIKRSRQMGLMPFVSTE